MGNTLHTFILFFYKINGMLFKGEKVTERNVKRVPRVQEVMPPVSWHRLYRLLHSGNPSGCEPGICILSVYVLL